MGKIIINKTKYSPEIILDDDGELTIIGRCIVEDCIIFFNPIFKWIEKFNKENLTVVLNLEYINTSSTKQLFNLLTIIKDKKIKTTYINWCYDEDDEDMLELGQDLESQVHIPFDFMECKLS